MNVTDACGSDLSIFSGNPVPTTTCARLTVESCDRMALHRASQCSQSLGSGQDRVRCLCCSKADVPKLRLVRTQHHHRVLGRPLPIAVEQRLQELVPHRSARAGHEDDTRLGVEAQQLPADRSRALCCLTGWFGAQARKVDER